MYQPTLRDAIEALPERTSWGLRVLPDELYDRALPYFTEANRYFGVPLYRSPMALTTPLKNAIWGGLTLGYLVRASDYVPTDEDAA